MADIAIVGAGPAGLMAALTAQRQGHHCVVYEASPSVGGMSGSFVVAGQRVDYGSHRLHPAADPALLTEIQRLVGDDLQTRYRNGRIRLDGSWLRFPLQAKDLARNAGMKFSLKAGADALRSPLRSDRGQSFAQSVEAGLGPTVVNSFYAPYARKLYGVEAEELGVELARRRVSKSSVGSIVSGLVSGARGRKPMFYYPRLGYGQIAEALAEAAVEAGADIRLETPVAKIVADDRSVVVGVAQPVRGHSALVELDQVDPGARGIDSSARSLVGMASTSAESFDVVLSTMPLRALARATEPQPGSEIMNALKAVRVRAMVLVYLVMDQPQFTPFDAHYLPDSHIVSSRLSEPKNYRDGPDPEDVTVLCGEIPCWVGDDLWTAADAYLGQMVVDDIARIGLGVVRPAEVVVRRLPSVYPVYERSTVAARRRIDSWARDLGRVITLGRGGFDVPDNLHHVLDMGDAAARVVGPDGEIDTRRWTSDRARFRNHVVED